MDPKICCFTGHRPQKLPFGYDEDHPDCLRLKEVLRDEILLKIQNGCTGFMTGMAMGADIWCAEIVLEFRKQFPRKNITLTAVIPYKNQAASYPADYLKRHALLLQNADAAVLIGENYAPGCMQKRNRYMVDNAGCLIAVWGGAPGGTGETLRYARKKGLDIVLIHPGSAQREQMPSQLHF